MGRSTILLQPLSLVKIIFSATFIQFFADFSSSLRNPFSCVVFLLQGLQSIKTSQKLTPSILPNRVNLKSDFVEVFLLAAGTM